MSPVSSNRKESATLRLRLQLIIRSLFCYVHHDILVVREAEYYGGAADTLESIIRVWPC
jgi:hypothetical protein